MKRPIIVINEKTRILTIGIAIALVTFIISYNLIYRKYAKDKDSLRSAIEEETKRLSLRKEYAALANSKDEYTNYLYANADTNAVRNAISEFARKSGLETLSIQPQQPDKIGNNYIKISFSVSLRGSYNRLGKFIESIESYPMVTVIEKLVITNIGTDTPKDETVAEIALLISAYCRLS